MGAFWNKAGSLAWYGNKTKEINDAYELYQRTGSDSALADVAAKTGVAGNRDTSLVC